MIFPGQKPPPGLEKIMENRHAEAHDPENK